MKFVVATCSFNQENIIEKFIDEYVKILEILKNKKEIDEYNIHLIDDGSTDNTWANIKLKSNNNKNIKGIRLKKNIGQHFACFFLAGRINGDYISFVNADLDITPDNIIEIINIFKEEKSKIIISIADNRPIINKILSNIFFYITKLLSNLDTPGNVTAISIDSDISENLKNYIGPKFFTVYNIANLNLPVRIHKTLKKKNYNTSSYTLKSRLYLAISTLTRIILSKLFFEKDITIEEEI